MHETAVAENLLQAIIGHAKKIGRRPLTAKVSCGQFNALNDDALRFAFSAAAQETVCGGMRIDITHIPLCARCGNCGRVFEFCLQEPLCPQCRSDNYQFEPDAQIILEEIEFEDTE